MSVLFCQPTFAFKRAWLGPSSQPLRCQAMYDITCSRAHGDFSFLLLVILHMPNGFIVLVNALDFYFL